MFWNEPSLYGVTLPFDKIPQTPFFGQFPKFVPQQFIPPYLPMNYQYQFPFYNQFQLPFYGQFPQVPFMDKFQLPFYGMDKFQLPFYGMDKFQLPYGQFPFPFTGTLPYQNWYKPFIV